MRQTHRLQVHPVQGVRQLGGGAAPPHRPLPQPAARRRERRGADHGLHQGACAAALTRPLQLPTLEDYSELQSATKNAYKGFKARLKKLGPAENSKASAAASERSSALGGAPPAFGVRTLASDPIKDVIGYQYERDFVQLQQLRAQAPDTSKEKVMKNVPNKASELREQHLKKKFADVLESQNRKMWKLKQFEGVGASEEIAAVSKRRGRPENKSFDLMRAGGGISAVAGRSEDYIAANLEHKDRRNYKSVERRDQFWETSSKGGAGKALSLIHI